MILLETAVFSNTGVNNAHPERLSRQLSSSAITCLYIQPPASNRPIFD